MKKLIFSVFTASTLFLACSKSEIQQTTDSIKSADSLFKQAKDGFKTLDSISKIVNDSNSTVGKVLVPEINKHKEIIEDAIKNGNISIDSINREFEKINNKTKQADEIRKAIDSANNAIKSGNNAAVVIAETASKILKQTSKKNNPVQTKPESQPQQEVQNQAPQTNQYPQQNERQVIQSNPISKTARLQISVDDLSSAKAILDQELRNYNGDLITENFTESEGVAKEFVTVKVPLNNFNDLVNKISTLGSVESKTTEIEGTDYIASQMCDVEVTLVDKTPEQSTINKDLNVLNKTEKKDSFGDAFSKGFTGFKDVLLALVPFWPVALIGGLVWYFVARNNKKKREEEFQRQLALEREKMKNAQTSTPSNQAQNTQNFTEQNNSQENKDDDITRFMPKNDN